MFKDEICLQGPTWTSVPTRVFPQAPAEFGMLGPRVAAKLSAPVSLLTQGAPA